MMTAPHLSNDACQSLADTTLVIDPNITERATVRELLAALPTDCVAAINDGATSNKAAHHTPSDADKRLLLSGFVDGRALPCPMPLLKTKVALRGIECGESLYVVATDPNSQTDIRAFCDQSWHTTGDHYALLFNTATSLIDSGSLDGRGADTIFHFIITKTDSKA